MKTQYQFPIDENDEPELKECIQQLNIAVDKAMEFEGTLAMAWDGLCFAYKDEALYVLYDLNQQDSWKMNSLETGEFAYKFDTIMEAMDWLTEETHDGLL